MKGDLRMLLQLFAQLEKIIQVIEAANRATACVLWTSVYETMPCWCFSHMIIHFLAMQPCSLYGHKAGLGVHPAGGLLWSSELN